MKKLFFAAAVAVVAIGGAITSQANTYVGTTTSTVYNCSGNGQLCRIFIPAAGDAQVVLQGTTTPIPSATLPDTQKRP